MSKQVNGGCSGSGFFLKHFFGFFKKVIFWDKIVFEAGFWGFMGFFGVRIVQKLQKNDWCILE